MDQSDMIIKIMTHEERIRRLVNRYKAVRVIVNNHKLLEGLSFGFAIAINFIIVASYSQDFFNSDPFDRLKGNKNENKDYEKAI